MEKVDGSTQTVTQEPHQELTRLAHRARDRLRYAEMLKRRRTKGSNTFTDDQRALLEELDLGTLRTEANDATRKSGWGRIKHADGTFEDLAPHNGGIVRTVLDHIVLEEISEAEELTEEQCPTLW